MIRPSIKCRSLDHKDNSTVIFRPHRSITYVDMAYCYQPSSVVCQSVTLVSPAKTAGPIEMPFQLRNWVDPMNDVLDRGPYLHGKWQFFFFGGGKRRPIVK